MFGSLELSVFLDLPRKAVVFTSLAVYIRVGDAQILAVDSCMSLRTQTPGQPPEVSFLHHGIKVWALPPPHAHIGAAGFGSFGEGGRSVGDILLEFARGQKAGTVEETARALGPFIAARVPGRTSFFVCGYDETAYYGRSFLVSGNAVSDMHGHGATGLSLGGQKAVADAVVQSVKVPLEFMSPDDAVSMARWFVRLTRQAQAFSRATPTVGGKTRVLVLTRGQSAKLV